VDILAIAVKIGVKFSPIINKNNPESEKNGLMKRFQRQNDIYSQ